MSGPVFTDARRQFHQALLAKLLVVDKKGVASNADGDNKLSQDYVISPDILVVRAPESGASINAVEPLVGEDVAQMTSLRAATGARPSLHASISCKWTLRSNRAQNARAEALNLIRNRKGRVPHIAVLTGEPLPSRIASLALGTGDLDCVYHIALPELQGAIEELGNEDSRELMETMVSGKRLRDIADLPLDLAI